MAKAITSPTRRPSPRSKDSGRVAFRYCDAAGAVGGAANPNGSIDDIAGVYSAGFNVLGLMPHRKT